MLVADHMSVLDVWNLGCSRLMFFSFLHSDRILETKAGSPSDKILTDENDSEAQEEEVQSSSEGGIRLWK